ncbi:hypothetical protein [Amycolatopsis sp. NPDC051061]|uniref:hypothetical protein n=1 Tax=Amycolatopsis sp. NPDC051061 TaxID=3155042 RepID=UPI00342CB892
MIDRHEGDRFPYRMHDAVREAIRHTDFQVSVGLPLPETPSQWLEPPEEVGRRWTGHLDAYLARHGATREGLRPR